MKTRPELALSPEDRARVASIEDLARQGSAGGRELVELLADPSWAVRRAVIAALARLGEPAVEGLCDVLLGQRDSETRLAAAVDALALSEALVESRLMAMAESSDPAVVCDAAQVLGRRRAVAAIPLLARLADHADDNVAVAAIEALGRIGGADTVAPLMAAVEKKNFFRTYPALDALGRTGDARAVPLLAMLLGDPLYANEATRALGHTGQGAAVAPLARLLSRPIDALVRTAALALADLYERHEAQYGDTDTLARSLPESVSVSTVSERLARCVPGAVAAELVAIARVFGWLGGDQAIGELIELAIVDGTVGAAAVAALRRLGAQATPHLVLAIRAGDARRRLRLLPLVGYARAAVEGLVVCLDDADPAVRVRACEALARAGDTSTVAALFRLISDRDPRVSQAAAAAIQSLGSQETRELAIHQARSPDPTTRRAALRILAYFGYPEGLEALIEAMDDPDDKIREVAIQGLGLIGTAPALEALLRAGAETEASRPRGAVMRALGQTTRDPAVVAMLSRSLADHDPWVRYYACQSLGKLRSEEACEAILPLLADEAGQVRVAAVEALAHLSNPLATDALVRAAESEDDDIRRAALVGLGIGGRPEALPILRAASNAPSAATRLVAISALATFQAPEALAALARASTDADDAVQSAAIGYISTRPGPEATKVLLDLVGDASLRDRVLAALAVAGDERIEGILAALETAEPERATVLVAALMRMRRPSSHAAIASVLLFDNVAARRAAANALAALGTSKALEVLARSARSDPDPEVRRVCASVTQDR